MEESDLINPIWKKLVLKKKQVNLNFLPAKILLSRLQITLKNESSADVIQQAANEVFRLYLNNKELPNAKKDILLLLNK